MKDEIIESFENVLFTTIGEARIFCANPERKVIFQQLCALLETERHPSAQSRIILTTLPHTDPLTTTIDLEKINELSFAHILEEKKFSGTILNEIKNHSLFLNCLRGYFPQEVEIKNDNYLLFQLAYQVQTTPGCNNLAAAIELASHLQQPMSEAGFAEFLKQHPQLNEDKRITRHPKPNVKLEVKDFDRQLILLERSPLFSACLQGHFPSDIPIRPENLAYFLTASLVVEHNYNPLQAAICLCLLHRVCENPLHIFYYSHAVTSEGYVSSLKAYAQRLKGGSRSLYTEGMCHRLLKGLRHIHGALEKDTSQDTKAAAQTITIFMQLIDVMSTVLMLLSTSKGRISNEVKIDLHQATVQAFAARAKSADTPEQRMPRRSSIFTAKLAITGLVSGNFSSAEAAVSSPTDDFSNDAIPQTQSPHIASPDIIPSYILQIPHESSEQGRLLTQLLSIQSVITEPNTTEFLRRLKGMLEEYQENDNDPFSSLEREIIATQELCFSPTGCPEFSSTASPGQTGGRPLLRLVKQVLATLPTIEEHIRRLILQLEPPTVGAAAGIAPRV